MAKSFNRQTPTVLGLRTGRALCNPNMLNPKLLKLADTRPIAVDLELHLVSLVRNSGWILMSQSLR